MIKTQLKRKVFLPLKAKVHYFLWLQRTRRFRRECAAVGGYDPDRTYLIEPRRIQLALDSKGLDRLDPNVELPITPLRERGRIMDGDWDLKAIRFEDMDVWNSFQHRFQKGGEWHDTPFYQRVVRQIEGGVRMWGCTTRAEFEKRLGEIDALFRDIQDNGYRDQSHINGFLKPFGNEDEIHVHIGRHGDYIFADGRHRLCIAKILGLEKVPVKVARRHEQWISFRHEVLAYARKTGTLYAPIPHPDLSDVPAAHSHERMELIKRHLPGGANRVLDIGTHWGYFCHCFEALGYQCTAVEKNPLNVRFLEKLRRAENNKFQIVQGSILDQYFVDEFDIVLALNIFHHFLKEKESYEKFIKFLSGLKTRVMFFEPHCPDEPQMKGAFRNYSPREFTEFIKNQGKFHTYEQIGELPDGRLLFKLSK